MTEFITILGIAAAVLLALFLALRWFAKGLEAIDLNNLTEGAPNPLEHVQIPAWRSHVGEGWHPLLDELHARLLEVDPGYRVAQLKEKFGGLRVYCDWSDGPGAVRFDLAGPGGVVSGMARSGGSSIHERAQPIVDEYEARSYEVCERCGGEGEPRTQSADGGYAWVLTLCDDDARREGYLVTEKYVTGTGQKMRGVHPEGTCALEHCVVHNPSGHHMRGWKTHWRQDRGIMERICPHGIGHPDPDDMAFHAHRIQQEARNLEDLGMQEEAVRALDEIEGLGVHGCDGCCADRREEP